MLTSPVLFSPALNFAYPPTPVALHVHQHVIGRQPSIVSSAFGHSPPLVHPTPAFASQRPVPGIPPSGLNASERSAISSESAQVRAAPPRFIIRRNRQHAAAACAQKCSHGPSARSSPGSFLLPVSPAFSAALNTQQQTTRGLLA